MQTTTFPAHVPADLRDRLTPEAWEAAERLLQIDPTAAALLKDLSALGSPPASVAPLLADAWRAFARWRARAQASPLPGGLAFTTLSAHELGALEALPSHLHTAQALDALRAALGESLKGARVQADPAREPAALINAPGGREALDLVGHASAEEVTTTRWLAWRRNERERLLIIRALLPDDAIAQQLALRLPDATPDDAEAITRVTRDALLHALDERAHRDAFEEAERTYLGLLQTPPLKAERVAALFVGAPRQPLGAALTDASGDLLNSTTLTPDPGWADRLKAWLRANKADAFVLPTSAADRERLKALRDLLPAVPVLVKPAGIHAAREALQGRLAQLPREAGAAHILASRALTPGKAWADLDPVLLGIAEYQNDLPEALLRDRLLDTRALAQHLHQSAPPAATLQVAPPTAHRLNPLVRTLEDLRVGMHLDAQVTNLTSFGAFVTFGLDTEGLIHISELADHRVSSPSDVLRIGQRVRARVVEVDLPRKRIGLSLRSEEQSSRSRQSRDKANALANLNKLFKL